MCLGVLLPNQRPQLNVVRGGQSHRSATCSPAGWSLCEVLDEERAAEANGPRSSILFCKYRLVSRDEFRGVLQNLRWDTIRGAASFCNVVTDSRWILERSSVPQRP